MEIDLLYNPHRGQQLFHDSCAVNRVLITGRQWGKTHAGAHEAVSLAFEGAGDCTGLIAAPTYFHTVRCWEEMLKVLSPQFKVLVADVNRAEHCLTLVPERKIWFRSADNPDAMRSMSWAWSWFDECAIMSEQAYFAAEPALFGRNIFTTTPKGHNWVYRLFARGQPGNEKYESWNFPSTDNPYYDRSKFEEARESWPDLLFRQEYLGEFVEDIGAVFRNVHRYVNKDLTLAPRPDETYVVGADLARTEDFQVSIALNLDGELRGFERYRQLDWTLQIERLVNFARRYNNARILLDASGVGDPVYDAVRRQYGYVSGYKFTSSTKADLVENLSVMLDKGKLSYPDIPELTSELRMYGYKLGQTGVMQYNAPQGQHDDCVVTLALAAWMLRSAAGSQAIRVMHARRPR